MQEKRHEHSLPEVTAGGKTKFGAAEALAFVAKPRTVRPRAHNDRIVDARVFGLDTLVGVPSSVEILGIEETTDRQHGTSDIVQVRENIPCLPELIVIRVGNDCLPEWDLVVKVAFVDIGQWPQVQEKLITIRSFVIKPLGPLGCRPFTNNTEGREEIKGQIEAEGSVMVHVIEIPVSDRRRGHGCLDRRVGVDDACRGVETQVGIPPDADLAVVVLQMGHQPLDRVIRIGALVNLRHMRPHIDELTIRHKSSTDVLLDKDKTLANHFLGQIERLRITINPVGPNAVGRPCQEHRIGLPV